MSFARTSQVNHLIANLPDDVRQRWLPRLEPVELKQGAALHESGCQMGAAYFPTTAVVSLVYETSDGASMELAMVGNEGIVGVELLLGGGSTPGRAVVRTPGLALRLPAGILRDEFDAGGRRVASAAALRHGFQHPGGADGGVRPPPCAGTAPVRMAAHAPGSGSGQRARRHARKNRRHAWRQAGGRYRGRASAAASGPDPLFARACRRARPTWPRGPGVRVLCGGQEGVSAPAACDGRSARVVNVDGLVPGGRAEQRPAPQSCAGPGAGAVVLDRRAARRDRRHWRQSTHCNAGGRSERGLNRPCGLGGVQRELLGRLLH